VLVTSGCTTGWTDWIHGELWLCPDGLFRESVGLWATIRHGAWRTVNPASRPTKGVRLDLRVHGREITLMWVPVDDVSPLVGKLDAVLGDRFSRR